MRQFFIFATKNANYIDYLALSKYFFSTLNVNLETYISANLKMDRAMIREAKGTELENDDGATATVVNLPAWSAGHKRQSSASN